ncbi:MAG TPA: polyribonucleotide nucleotidyltransferase [Crocinitomicaceae bacterium]|nr:polyribonucleotide nucleotidyltransferase [Crocinitomicaceae bacterium]
MKEYSIDINGEKLTFQTGKLATMIDGSCVVSFRNEILLATAGMSKKPREGIDFFPLMCEYQPKYYATGKIKGSRFIKRETRPPESAILISRMIDRPLRPMFPKGMQNEVQLIVTLLQSDASRSVGTLAITAASMALQLSGIPIEEAVSAVRVGLDENGEFILDPTFDQAKNGDLDLVVAGSADSIMMVEAGARLVDDAKMVAALEFAHTFIKKICEAQAEFASQMDIKVKTPVFKERDEANKDAVDSFVTNEMLDGIKGVGKHALHEKVEEVENALLENFAGKIEEGELSERELKYFFDKKWAHRMRQNILEKGIRLDGRDTETVRPLSTEVGILPRTHGSGLFNRGETQCLSVVTIGSPSAAQLVDDADQPEYSKAYMHHYNFPPYSVGEVRMLRGTNRREIGHGILGERALEYVMPTKDDGFPYVVRVVSEILSCNGSSSMAATCGSTLALMDAGVPIKSPISGVAMGLITDGDSYKILTDIQAQEDFCGDMDLKVCGDENGITSLQMDIKLKGLSMDLLIEALGKAKIGRTTILENMKATIPESREKMSKFAPQIIQIKIPEDKIRIVIGKGGETIQGLCAKYIVKIDLDDDGTVYIAADHTGDAAGAVAAIKSMIYVPKEGDIFENATVKNIMDFGAFVEYTPGQEALVHISEIAEHRVEKVTDELKEGQKVTVKIIGIDHLGRVKLSIKAVK